MVSVARDRSEALLALAAEHGVPARAVGTTGTVGGAARLTVGGVTVERSSERLRDIWERAIPRRLEAPRDSRRAAGA